MNNYDDAIKELEGEINNIKNLSELITDVGGMKNDIRSQNETIKQSIRDLNKIEENINNITKSIENSTEAFGESVEFSSKNIDSILEKITDLEKLLIVAKNTLESEYNETKKISTKVELIESNVTEKNNLALNKLEEVKLVLEKETSKINILSIVVPLIFVINCIIVVLLIK